MEKSKVKKTGWGSLILVVIYLFGTWFYDSYKNSKEIDYELIKKPKNERVILYESGFAGKELSDVIIDGVPYMNYAYFDVYSEERFVYTFREGEEVKFFTENENDEVWIVNKSHDSIGNLKNIGSYNGESAGNGFRKIILINKTAKYLGGGTLKK